MTVDKPSPAQEANTMQSEALKPCPFCGGNNLRFRLSDIEGWIAHVECTDCDDMLGPMSEWKHDNKEDAEKDAAVVWNRRPCLEAALSAAEPDGWICEDEFTLEREQADEWGDEGSLPKPFYFAPQQSAQVQDVAGWKLVPIKPTSEMIAAGFEIDGSETIAEGCWEVMVAAAPAKQEG